MDRQIAYTGAIPQTGDILKAEKATMVALGYMGAAFLGNCATPQVDGLACTPTSPASLQVNVGVGSLYSAQTVDSSAYGDLGTDTTHTIVKQGLLQDPATLTITPPGTVGFSQVYLVQAIYADVDGGSAVLPYYNAANPSVPFSGPANAGTSNFTVRQGKITVSLKAGTAATTGTQTTPSPDAGYVALYAITVANGATTITSGNIATIAAAPFIPVKLPAIPAAVQNGQWTYAADTGTANNLVATLSPAPAALVAGLTACIKLANTPTGATALNLNGLGNKNVVLIGGGAFANLDYAAGDILWLTYDGAQWVSETPIRSALIDTAITKTVYGTTPDFATLTEAFDWLSRRRISSTGSVLLQLRSGQQVKNGSANSLSFFHPDGSRISIAGATLTGSYPANASFAATGNSSGTRATNTATNLTLLRTVFATELRFTGGAGFTIRGNIGSITNILFTGDGTAVDGPQFINGAGTIDTLSAVGFGSRGVVISGGGGWGVSKLSGLGSGGVGVFIDGTSIGLTGAMAGYGNGSHGVSIGSASSVSNSGGNINGNGNAGEGVLCDGSTAICGASSTANTNGFNGFKAVGAIKFDCQSCTASANSVSGTGTGVGFSATDRSFMDARNSGGTGNLYGYVASVGSTINSTGGGANGSVTQYSPALNTVGSGNSIIIG